MDDTVFGVYSRWMIQFLDDSLVAGYSPLENTFVGGYSRWVIQSVDDTVVG